MYKRIIQGSVASFLLALSTSTLSIEKSLWYFPNTSDPTIQGFMRITNNSNNSGTVTITATDEAGTQAQPISFTLGSRETKGINSNDLEYGNADKDIQGGTGQGHGHWRLKIESSLDFDARGYMRTQTGFVTSIHDRADKEGDEYIIPIFNPGSNPNQVSSLRVTNLQDSAAQISISGIDDSGTSFGPAQLTLNADRTVELKASDLENGNAGLGLPAGLGDGSGKWRLSLQSEAALAVVNLLTDPNGFQTNLSGLPPTEKPFTVTSNNFSNGDSIPTIHACTDEGGSNTSPQLLWKNAPAGTKSFAVIMQDEISPCGTGTQACIHWNVLNIPKGTTELKEGQDFLNTNILVKSEYSNEYFGPCPPANHAYSFYVYALGSTMPTLSISDIGNSGLSKSGFESTYQQHILLRTSIVGHYQ